MIEVRTKRGGIKEFAVDARVWVSVKYMQSNSGDQPHVAGTLAEIWVGNKNVVGSITFTFAEHVKEKTITVDVTDHLAVGPNFVGLTAILDHNFAEPHTSSALQFSIVVSDTKIVDDTYSTIVPLRTLDDSWMITKPG